MTENEKAQLKLECLKLAKSFYVNADQTKVMALATELYNYITM